MTTSTLFNHSLHSSWLLLPLSNHYCFSVIIFQLSSSMGRFVGVRVERQNGSLNPAWGTVNIILCARKMRKFLSQFGLCIKANKDAVGRSSTECPHACYHACLWQLRVLSPLQTCAPKGRQVQNCSTVKVDPRSCKHSYTWVTFTYMTSSIEFNRSSQVHKVSRVWKWLQDCGGLG